MSVYVDMLLDYGWQLGPSCHMIADSEVELHAFALKIGLKRSWHQSGDSHTLSHYDLTTGKRLQAVKAGAVEINRNQLIEKIHEYKQAIRSQGLAKCGGVPQGNELEKPGVEVERPGQTAEKPSDNP